MPPPRCKLTSDLLTLKVVSESRVTWATSVPILVFLGLSALDLGPVYATDRRQTSDAHYRLMPLRYRGRGIINQQASHITSPQSGKNYRQPLPAGRHLL